MTRTCHGRRFVILLVRLCTVVVSPMIGIAVYSTLTSRNSLASSFSIRTKSSTSQEQSTTTRFQKRTTWRLTCSQSMRFLSSPVQESLVCTTTLRSPTSRMQPSPSGSTHSKCRLVMVAHPEQSTRKTMSRRLHKTSTTSCLKSLTFTTSRSRLTHHRPHKLCCFRSLSASTLSYK